MPVFSKNSLIRLKTCHKDLQTICNELIKVYDFVVLCGHRGEEEQNEAFLRGNSKVRWPNSKHNTFPSLAVDIAPWKKTIDWNDHAEFHIMANKFLNIAKKLEIPVVWGGTFKTLVDLPHFELNIKKEN